MCQYVKLGYIINIWDISHITCSIATGLSWDVSLGSLWEPLNDLWRSLKSTLGTSSDHCSTFHQLMLMQGSLICIIYANLHKGGSHVISQSRCDIWGHGSLVISFDNVTTADWPPCVRAHVKGTYDACAVHTHTHTREQVQTQRTHACSSRKRLDRTLLHHQALQLCFRLRTGWRVDTGLGPSPCECVCSSCCVSSIGGS